MPTKSCGTASPATDDAPGANRICNRKLYSFDEARRKARTYGFISQQEFIEYECAGPYQLPKNSDEVWKAEWTSWECFLGVPPSWTEARACARNLTVQTKEDYQALLKSGNISDDELASRLPYQPDLYYKREWISWQDFLQSQ